MPGLDYDNSAASFFGLTVLGFFLVPAGFYIQHRIRSFKAAQAGPKASDKARSRAEKAQLEEWEAANADILWTPPFRTLCIVTGAAALAFVVLALLVRNAPAALATYDPFAILGISASATEREIKSAYRKLSLLHHPDKGGSVDKFQSISKAYEALTDPVAAENYRLYGNPDGKQPMQVSIGLPTALQGGFTGYLFLLAYLGALVVALPMLMFVVYGRNKGLDSRTGLRDLTTTWLVARLERTPGTINTRTMAEVVAGCKDFEALHVAAAQAQGVDPRALVATETALLDGVRAAIAKEVGWSGLTPLDPQKIGFSWFYSPEMAQRNTLLLTRFMHRNNAAIGATKEVASMRASVRAMLEKMPKIIQVCIEMAAQLETVSEQKRLMALAAGRKDASAVRYLDICRAILRFSQMVTQGIGEKDNELQQVLSAGFLEHVYTAKYKGVRKPSNIKAYLALPRGQRTLGVKGPSPEDAREIEAVASALPDLAVTPKLEVVGYPDICEGDVITATVSIVHQNLLPPPASTPAGKAAAAEALAANPSDPAAAEIAAAAADAEAESPEARAARFATGKKVPVPRVHAVGFPSLKAEEWHVFLVNERPASGLPGAAGGVADALSKAEGRRILAHKRLSPTFASEDVTFLFQAPHTAGVHPFSIHVISADYVGLDVTVDVPVTVLPKPKPEAPPAGVDGEESDEGDASGSGGGAAGDNTSIEEMLGSLGRRRAGVADDDSDIASDDGRDEEEVEAEGGADAATAASGGADADADAPAAAASGGDAEATAAAAAAAPSGKTSAAATKPVPVEVEEQDIGAAIVAGGGSGKKGSGKNKKR